MQISTVLITGAFLAALALTGLVRVFVRGYGLLDVPNYRSSHAVPTPRGGGIAIVLIFIAGISATTLLHMTPEGLYCAVIFGGLPVAIVGLMDDCRRLPATTRLVVHVVAAAVALGFLGGIPPVRLGNRLVTLGWSGYAIGALGIVWSLNLFNFMDGIDGIAAAESIFVCGAGALAISTAAGSGGLVTICLVMSAACCGFLIWNWPPAKIFMGDVGSGFVGYVLSLLALWAGRVNHAALWIWLILGAVFLVDATVTLLGRAVRRQRLQDAHRSHAYQRLSRRWGSHKRVTMAVICVNIFWLLPNALLAAARPSWAALISLAAITPVAAIAIFLGAGRAEG